MPWCLREESLSTVLLGTDETPLYSNKCNSILVMFLLVKVGQLGWPISTVPSVRNHSSETPIGCNLPTQNMVQTRVSSARDIELCSGYENLDIHYRYASKIVHYFA